LSKAGFPISRDPPEGGTKRAGSGVLPSPRGRFPISRDPPEGGTQAESYGSLVPRMFPISRDPPEGGTAGDLRRHGGVPPRFQFLGIPPKGELR